jgi:hypothetical protein
LAQDCRGASDAAQHEGEMSMSRTVEIELYQFDELSDDAKDVARNWYRSYIETDEISDHDDWQAVAEILGIQFSTQAVKLYGGGTRHDPVIYWELNPASAAFRGRYSYAKGAPKRIRAYAPEDTALHGIADALQLAQRKAFYRLTADCTTDGRGGTSQGVQVFRLSSYDYPEYIDHDGIEEALRDFAHWIARQVDAQWDYLNSSENVDECIRINEYEFTDDGERA